MGFDPCAFLLSDDGPEPLQPDLDPKVEEAEQTLVGFFTKHPDQTYYEGQLKVLFEDTYFHWVTTRALRQLAAKSKLATDLLSAKPFPIRSYRSPRHRYWRRQAKEIAALIEEFSDPSFTHALGHQGEMMFDAALPRGGFLHSIRTSAPSVTRNGRRQATISIDVLRGIEGTIQRFLKWHLASL